MKRSDSIRRVLTKTEVEHKLGEIRQFYDSYDFSRYDRYQIAESEFYDRTINEITPLIAYQGGRNAPSLIETYFGETIQLEWKGVLEKCYASRARIRDSPEYRLEVRVGGIINHGKRIQGNQRTFESSEEIGHIIQTEIIIPLRQEYANIIRHLKPIVKNELLEILQKLWECEDTPDEQKRGLRQDYDRIANSR